MCPIQEIHLEEEGCSKTTNDKENLQKILPFTAST